MGFKLIESCVPAYDIYAEGCYSPKLLKLSDIPVEVSNNRPSLSIYYWCASIGRADRRGCRSK